MPNVQNWFGNIESCPTVVVQAHSVDDLVAILKDSKKYPSPVRAVGSNHSTARCGVADAGTLVEMKMNRILSISEDTVTAEAGALYIDIAAELRRHGLQFYVNTEIGSLSVGSAACAATKDASMPDQWGQVASYVSEVKMVLPSGQRLTVDESDRDLLECVRSSYGTFGIIYEATFRVRPIQPMAVHYHTFSLEEFVEELENLKNRHESMMWFLFPFSNQITVEFRKYDPSAHGRPNPWVWKLRNLMWRTVTPWCCNKIEQVIACRAKRYLVIDFINFVLRRILYLLGNKNTVATDQIIRYPEVSDACRYTFSIWAFPEETYPDVLREYFQFCRDYYREKRYRTNMPNVGYRIAQDRQSLLSYSFDGPVMTVDPVSTGNKGWEDFLVAYNEFCSERGGAPLLNQTYGVKRAQAQKAFGKRLETFRVSRNKYDPDHRLLNDYFRDLLE